MSQDAKRALRWFLEDGPEGQRLEHAREFISDRWSSEVFEELVELTKEDEE